VLFDVTAAGVVGGGLSHRAWNGGRTRAGVSTSATGCCGALGHEARRGLGASRPRLQSGRRSSGRQSPSGNLHTFKPPPGARRERVQ
jgi:hypothetical protein